MADTLPSWGGWGSAVRDDPFGHFAEARCPVQKVRLAPLARSRPELLSKPCPAVTRPCSWPPTVTPCPGRTAAWSCAASSHSPSSSGHAGINHRPIHQTKENR